jgi:hypothetical protein
MVGKAAVPDGAHVTLCRVGDAGGSLHEIPHEARLLPRKHVEHVVQHQHLARAARARADADRRDAQALRDLLPELGRYRLEHQQSRARRLELHGVLDQLLLGVLALALHAVAAELVHRLRREAEMSAHRNAAPGEKSYRVGELRAAFELHHLGARRHQLGRAAKRLLRRFLVAAERHVGDEEAALAAARDAARVVGHVGEGHRQRGVVSLQHHAERVADQQAVQAGGVEHRGEARVVAGEHGYFHAIVAQLLQRLDGHSRHPSLPS